MSETTRMLQERIETTLAVPGEQAVVLGNQAAMMAGICELLATTDPPPAVFVEAATNAAARKQEALNFLASGVCRVLWKCEGTEDWNFESLHGYLRDAILLGAVELDDSDKRMLNDYTNRLGALIDQPLESRDVPADPKPGDRPHCDPREFNECDTCYFSETGPRCQGCQSNELLITRLRSENTANRLLVKMFQEKCEPDKPDAMQEAVDAGLFDDNDELNRTPADISRSSAGVWSVNFRIGQGCAVLGATSPSLAEALRGAVVKMKTADRLEHEALERKRRPKVAEPTPPEPEYTTVNGELTPEALAKEPTPTGDTETAVVVRQNITCDLWRNEGKAPAWTISETYDTGRVFTFHVSADEGLGAWWNRLGTRVAPGQRPKPSADQPTPAQDADTLREIVFRNYTATSGAGGQYEILMGIADDLRSRTTGEPQGAQYPCQGCKSWAAIASDLGTPLGYCKGSIRAGTGCNDYRPVETESGTASIPTPSDDAKTLRAIADHTFQPQVDRNVTLLRIAARLEEPVDQDVAAARDRFNANIEAWRKAAGCPDGVYLTSWLEKLREKAKSSVPFDLPDGSFIRLAGNYDDPHGAPMWYRVSDSKLLIVEPFFADDIT